MSDSIPATTAPRPNTSSIPRPVLIGTGIAAALLLGVVCGVVGVCIGLGMRGPAPAPVVEAARELKPAADAKAKEKTELLPVVPVKGKEAVKAKEPVSHGKLIGKWETAGASLKPNFLQTGPLPWEFQADGTGHASIGVADIAYFGFGGAMEWNLDGEFCNIDLNGKRHQYRLAFEAVDKLVLTPTAVDAAKGSPTHVLKRFAKEREDEMNAEREALRAAAKKIEDEHKAKLERDRAIQIK